MRLFLLHLRRGVHPGLGLTLLAVALAVRFGTELPESVGLGAAEPEGILRGLRRADLLLAMLAILIPLSTLQGLRTWSKQEGRERAWLLSSPASKANMIFSSWAGNWCAALVWLLCTLGCCEALAGSNAAQEWRSAGALPMEGIQREGDEGHLRWSAPIPSHAGAARVHFEVGLFGSDADLDEFVLTSFEADGSTPFDSDRSQPGRISILDVGLAPGQERVQFKFETVGATRSLLLNKPRMQLFVATSAAVPSWLVLARVALLLAVAQALALGLCAWFSGATALTYVFGGYGLVWLEGERWAQTSFASWLPGFDLPEALGWLAQGRGPGQMPVQTWCGTLILVSLGLASVWLSLGRWRVGR